jgi:hypothetical protein
VRWNRHLIEVGPAPGASNLAQASTPWLIGGHEHHGIVRTTVHSAGGCQPLVGFTIGEPFSRPESTIAGAVAIIGAVYALAVAAFNAMMPE